MEIITILSLSITTGYVGYLFGVAKRIDDSERSYSEPYKEGYIKGYADCWKAVEEDGEYYAKFPKMGTN